MTKVKKNWLEWAVFAASLALVAATLGFLAYAGLTTGDAPPDIEVRLGTPQRRTENFLVPVTVSNRGDETAEGAKVEVTLEGPDGEELERSELDMPFLPRRSRREGWVAFTRDPGAGGARLKARVLGFEKP